ncbi:MAG: hypothetical protein AB7G93_07515 [Bdellovibrionales bacterium]
MARQQQHQDVNNGVEAAGATETWRRLYDYLWPRLEVHASRIHCCGIARLGYNPTRIPEFSAFVERVKVETGWTVVEAGGELDPLEFFRLLANKKFPVVRSMRPENQLYGGIDPDFWHEAFGHIPHLTDPGFSDLYHWFGCAAVQAGERNTKRVDDLSKLYWSIVEYGFLRERRDTKLFGAALIASPLAVERFLAGRVRPIPFHVRGVLSANYNPHQFQSHYVQIDSAGAALSALKDWYSRSEN